MATAVAQRVLVIAALWSGATWAQVVPFAQGQAQLTLPAGYTHELEEDGRTIAVRPSNKGLFELRMTYFPLPSHVAKRKETAEAFVSDMAAKKGRKVNRIKGSNSIGFLESGAASIVNGEPARNMHGVLSLGHGYVTMTLTVPEKHAQVPEVREFVGGGMEALLGGLRAGKT